LNSVIKNIKEKNNSLPPAQQSIAQQIINDPQILKKYTSSELAKISNTAVSTVDAFSKRVGFNGYSELRYSYIGANEEDLWLKSDFYKAWKNTNRVLDSGNFTTVIEELEKSERVFIFAYQMSQVPASDFYLRMQKLEPNKYYYTEDNYEKINNARRISKNDTIIFVSNSGEAYEIIELKKRFLKNNETQILITNDKNSTIAKGVNYVLSGEIQENNKLLFNETPIASRYVLILILEEIFKRIFEEDKELYLEKLEEIRKNSPKDY